MVDEATPCLPSFTMYYSWRTSKSLAYQGLYDLKGHLVHLLVMQDYNAGTVYAVINEKGIVMQCLIIKALLHMISFNIHNFK